jgi:hypothetical protein
MIIRGSATETLGGNAQHTQQRGQCEHPSRNLTPKRVDAPLEWRLRQLDVAQHRRQTPHRAQCSGPGHVEECLAPHEQRAAERFVFGTLVDRDRLAREDRFVEHGAMGITEDAIGRNAITRFEPYAVAWDERVHCKPHEPAVAKHPGVCARQRFQPCQCCFGPLFLIQPECGVEQQDHGDGARFERPPVPTLVHPESEVKGQREQQDVDQRTIELTREAAPERIGRLLRKRVRSTPCESFLGFTGRESAHHDSVFGNTRRSGRGRSHDVSVVQS